MKKVFIIIGLVSILLVFTLFLIRLVSEKQLDDVSSEIPCEPELLERADVFFVIPNFNNKSISGDKRWCEQIKSFDKELALHGIRHSYNEFLYDRDEAYLQEGIQIFEECFQEKPKRFKPPQIKISKNNKILVKGKMELDLYFNQIFHKVYHCNDTGKYPNWLIDWV